MNIGAIDTSATQGTSWLHAASPVSKLLALALVLTAVIVSWNAFVLLGALLVLAAAAASARLPARLTTVLAVYPALFAAVFAFASAPNWLMALTIVLKAVCAALGAVIVVLTTPYPQVFAPIQRITPSIVGDALLMTYRGTFLLLGRFSDTLRSVRLRAGLSGKQPLRSAKATTLALGGVLLYSIDLAQRDYDVMRLRGYERRLRVAPPTNVRRMPGVVALAGTGLLALVSIVWRVDWQALNPWSWLLPLPAFALLVAAIITGSLRRTS